MAETMVVRMDLGPCAVCGRPAFTVYGGGTVVLADQAPLCGNCVRRIRFLYPVSQRMQRDMWITDDALVKLNTEEVREVMKTAPDRLENLRDANDGCDAVFRVDQVQTEKTGLFRIPVLRLKGYPLYGRFNMGEDAVLIHEGTAYPVHLDDVAGGSLLSRAGEAGYECTLKIPAKGIPASPGDTVVKTGRQ